MILAYLIMHSNISPFEEIPLFDLLWYTALAYNLILVLKLKTLAKNFHQIYFFWLFDLFLCAILLALSRGWRSPFFVYTISVLIIFARYSTWKVSTLVLLLWSILYYLTLVVNGFTPAVIKKLKELDILIAHYFYFFAVIFIITFLSKVIDRSDQQQEALKLEEKKAKKALEKVKQSLAQISTIQKIAQNISIQTEIKEMVKTCLHSLESTGFPRAALCLIESESISRWFRSKRFKEKFEEIPVIEIGNQSALGLALQKKKELIVVNSSHPLATEAQRLIGCSTSSTFVFIPLIVENKVEGALLVEATENKNFSFEDLELLKTFAGQISLAFFHALSREKIKNTIITEERNKIAKELHDSVLLELYGLSRILDSLNISGKKNLEKKVNLAKDIVERSLKTLQLAVLDGESSSLEKDFYDLVKKYSANFEKNTGIETKLSLDRHLPLLSPFVQKHLFRMIQESLHNVFKHAQAKQVVITMGYHKARKYFLIKIKDDGVGFSLREAKRKGGAKGLRNLRERAQEIEANLKIKTRLGQGTEIKIELPWTMKKNESSSR